MDKEQKVLQEILWRLPDIWKRFFGLFTQEIGYLTIPMFKTLISLKRIADSNWDFDCSDLTLSSTNELAFHFNLEELPFRPEMESVLPRLWSCLSEYDLSEEGISQSTWDDFMAYLDKKHEKR